MNGPTSHDFTDGLEEYPGQQEYQAKALSKLRDAVYAAIELQRAIRWRARLRTLGRAGR